MLYRARFGVHNTQIAVALLRLVSSLHAPQEICGEAAHKWSLKKVAMAHRTGVVGIGSTSVIIAVSSAHRADALEVSLLCT